MSDQHEPAFPFRSPPARYLVPEEGGPPAPLLGATLQAPSPAPPMALPPELGPPGVERVADMLAGLPAGLSASDQRQVVYSALRAFGVQVPELVRDGEGKLAQLEAAESMSRRDLDVRRREVQEEIQRLTTEIGRRESEHAQMVAQCALRRMIIQDTLSFLSALDASAAREAAAAQYSRER